MTRRLDDLHQARGEARVGPVRRHTPELGPLGRLLRHPALHGFVFAAVLVSCYAPALGRAFVSVDYLFLGRLALGGFGEVFVEQATGPFLGFGNAPFYRPLSTLLVQLELLLFGLQPGGYLVLHLCVHLLNAWLVHAVVRRLWGGQSRAAAWAVTLVFAFHPLHLNTVAFVSSYATLSMTTCLLGCCLAHLADRRRLAVLLYLLALGCYEQAAVLPALLLMHDAIGARRGGWAGWWRAHGGYWLVAGCYFVFRRLLLGNAVGGYNGMRDQVLSIDLTRSPLEFMRGLASFAYPDFDLRLSDGLLAGVGLLVLSATLLSLWRCRRAGDAPRWWLLGLCWYLIVQLPYALAPVVGANGRYGYLATIGLGLLAVAVGKSLRVPRKLPQPARVLLPAVVMLGAQLPLLVQTSEAYRDAGQLAAHMRAAATQLDHEPGQPLFLGGQPPFLSSPGGSPVAQVFAWGLSSALRPPFSETDLRAYALPRLDLTALRPLLGEPGTTTAWWIDNDWAVLPAARGRTPGSVEIQPRDDDPLSFNLRSNAPHHRLIVLSRINPLVLAVERAPQRGGWETATLPAWLVEIDNHLIGDVIYWWIEGRGGSDDALLSLSPLQTLRPLNE